jgi:soluble lytic murein transglycosylase
VYIETIPFGETRDYVKKVMANAQFYAQRLGLTKQALKARLGNVVIDADVLAATSDAEL